MDSKWTENRLCPIYKNEISADLCYDTVTVSLGIVKREYLPELNDVQDCEERLCMCKECHYSGIGEFDI